MAHAAVAQNFISAFGAARQTIRDIEGEDWRQLFDRQREVAPHTGNVRHQAARPRRHCQSGQLGNHFDRLADDSRI
jgi:hypothetical protein